MPLSPARPPFIGCRPDPAGAHVVLYGIPFEGRVNQRKGAALGPGEIRRASDLLETYAPALGVDLADLALADAGDVHIPDAEPRAALRAVRDQLRDALDPRQRWVFLGGDHTVTAPVVEVALAHYPDLRVVQFDAHPDLRREFLGEAWNYASAMSRVLDCLRPDRLYQIGLRTGDREEWTPARGTRVFPAWEGPAPHAAAQVATEVAGRPLYVTIDIDVLDPGFAPGTGTPEAGGLTSRELLGTLRGLAGLDLVAADVVEVAPPYDHAEVTAVAASHAAYELLALFARGPGVAGS